MAQFLRGKQAGIQNDLSAGLTSDLFDLDDFARYGVNSQICAVAYDPVQSLLAVGTTESNFGSGQVYVFGQRRVEVIYKFQRKASAKFLQFCADKLIAVDSKNDLCVFSLETKKILTSYAPPSGVTALASDPSLEYAFLGLQNGEVIAYDLDREALTPFRLPNLWLERNQRARLAPVLTLAFSPRDIGKLLIAYPDGAVTFSIKQNVPQKYFEYQVPAGAPGGDPDPSHMKEARRPRLVRALWHPNGHFVLTVHEDTSLVLWDAKDGRILMARTLENTNVDQPKGTLGGTEVRAGTFSVKEPIFQAAWCAKGNPDDTGLLIAGGRPTTTTEKGLTFLDFGPTPVYQTSSWQILSKYFESPKKTILLATPPGAEVVDFCLIPRSSPYFAGAQDPIAVIAVLSSGELVTLSFPTGHPITPSNMLHVSLSLVHPFVTKIALADVSRSNWLGLKEKRAQGPRFLIGGAEAKKQMKRFEGRNIALMAHADGIVRLWDTGHDDEIENGDVIQVDLIRAVNRNGPVEVTQLSFSGAAGELSVGLRSGELLVFRWGQNPNAGSEIPVGPNQGPGKLTNISQRIDPGLRVGLLPLTMLEMQQGPVTALKHSDVGFVCVGFEQGSIAIIDLRGPAIIFNAHVSRFKDGNKKGSIRRSRTQEGTLLEWPTSIEFGVLTLDGDDYSSICCFVGTSRGHFATFKILPAANGTYSAAIAGVTSLDDYVVDIHPIQTESGYPALATQTAVSGLRDGTKVNGVVVVATHSGCRIFRPAITKGAQKTWDDALCDRASIVRVEGRGHCLVGLFGDGTVRAYSLPAMKEIGLAKLQDILDLRRLGDAAISSTGDVLGWVGPSEIAVFNVWGPPLPLRPSEDRLFNEEAKIPSRPTISNIQWISGTQYMSPSDLDMLVGGPDRPPSKRTVEQMRADEQERRRAARGGRSAPENAAKGEQEGYWSYMQRQVQERTEQLGLTGDSMDRLEENSGEWANDVSKYVSTQKRKAVFGLLGSKLGL